MDATTLVVIVVIWKDYIEWKEKKNRKSSIFVYVRYAKYAWLFPSNSLLFIKGVTLVYREGVHLDFWLSG